MTLRNFIVFEGIDGAGTSTQVELLKARLGEKLFATAEPTNLATGVFLRRMLAGEFSVDERTAAYLFACDRCEHVFGKGGIVEQANAGKLVVSDRYLFSTLAYQSVSCGFDIPRLVNSPFPLPETLFYFRIDAHLAFSRIAGRGAKPEIYEKAEVQRKVAENYDRVIGAYREDAQASGMKIITLDAARSIQETADAIWGFLENLPIIKS